MTLANPRPHRPVKVQFRIFDKKELWGIVGNINGKDHRIGIRDMLGMMLNGWPFIVDVKGRDAPASLIAVHRKVKDGLIFYFRVIGDRIKGNEFSGVDQLSVNSRVLRKFPIFGNGKVSGNK